MAGGMGVRKNVHIENWASFRENCEHVFKFSKSNWARLAVFGIALPVAFYRLIVNELVCIRILPIDGHRSTVSLNWPLGDRQALILCFMFRGFLHTCGGLRRFSAIYFLASGDSGSRCWPWP